MNNELYKKEKIMMLISAAISGLFAIIALLEEELTILTCIQIIYIALILYTVYSVEDIKKVQRNIIIGIILSCMHFNVPAVALLVITKEMLQKKEYNSNAPPQKNRVKKAFEEKEKISDEARKVDILLKIGVFLVVLSGILFSTSSTGPIIDLFKPLFLLLLSGIFYGLSYLFKTKVIIKKSENTYYILSNLFIIFFAIALAYFKTFGEYLSFEGEGSLLVCSFISILTSLIVANLGRKYNNEALKTGSYLIIYVALTFALLFFEAQMILIISILLIISIIGYYKISKDNISYHNSRLVLIILLGVCAIFYNLMNIWDHETLFNGLLSAGLLVANLYLLLQENEETGYKMLFTYTSFFLLNVAIINTLRIMLPNHYDVEGIANAYIYTSFISLMAHHYFNKQKDLKYGGFALTSIMLAYSMVMMTSTDSFIILFITSLVLLVYSVLNIYKNDDEILQKIYFALQIILIFVVISSGVTALDIHFDIYISTSTIFLSYLCIVALIDIVEDEYITKIKLDLFLYYAIIILLSLVSVATLFENSIVFNLIVLAILLLYRVYVNKYIKNNDLINCVILTTTLFHLEYVLYQLIPTLAHPLLFVLLLLTAYFMRKDKVNYVFSIALSYLPYGIMISLFNLKYELEVILMGTPLLILVSIFSNVLVDLPKKTKTVLETIALSIIMCMFIFEANLFIGIYVGVISVIMMLIGTKNSKFNALFYTGIISLILNIYIQLQEFWSKIPVVVYTLIAGLLIIFYVTYKELNKNKKDQIKDKKIEYYEEKEYDSRINVICVILFIGYLIIGSAYTEISYDVKQLNKDKIVVEKFESLGLDDSKYFMTSKYSNMLYILEGNSLDLEYVYNSIGEDHLDVCWIDQEQFNKIKSGNNNLYYYDCLSNMYIYDSIEKPQTTYYKNSTKLSILNKNLYDYEVKSGFNSFYDKTTFNIYYNKYETNSVSFCINKENLDKYNLSVSASILNRIDGEGICYEASDKYGEIGITLERDWTIKDDQIITTPNDEINYN